jgi:hypothetical protein
LHLLLETALIIVLIVLKNADNVFGFFAQAGLATFILNVVVFGCGVSKWLSLQNYRIRKRCRLVLK